MDYVATDEGHQWVAPLVHAILMGTGPYRSPNVLAVVRALSDVVCLTAKALEVIAAVEKATAHSFAPVVGSEKRIAPTSTASSCLGGRRRSSSTRTCDTTSENSGKNWITRSGGTSGVRSLFAAAVLPYLHIFIRPVGCPVDAELSSAIPRQRVEPSCQHPPHQVLRLIEMQCVGGPRLLRVPHVIRGHREACDLPSGCPS